MPLIAAIADRYYVEQRGCQTRAMFAYDERLRLLTPYLQQLGCETLILGPGDIACAHQPNEYLELARIEPTVQILRQLIEYYCLRPAL